MERPTAHTPPPVVFKDGFGERYHAVTAEHEPLEVLALRDELVAVPWFEYALRESIKRLSTFHHELVPRARGVIAFGKPPSGLALVSDRIRGTRLAEVLNGLADRRLAIEPDAAFHLTGQLLSAVAALHAAGASHGAIAPERLILTRDGRLALVEHVLAKSIEHLGWAPVQHWTELRVARLPLPDAQPEDRRADIMQAALVAAALLLGRPLRDDEIPARAADLLNEASAVAGTPLHDWLRRALQASAGRSFVTASDALTELGRAIREAGYAEGRPASLDAFLSVYFVPPRRALSAGSPANDAASAGAEAPPAGGPGAAPDRTLARSEPAAPGLSRPAAAAPGVDAARAPAAAVGSSDRAAAAAAGDMDQRVETGPGLSEGGAYEPPPSHASVVPAVAAVPEDAARQAVSGPDTAASQPEDDEYEWVDDAVQEERASRGNRLLQLAGSRRQWIAAAALIAIALTSGVTFFGRRLFTSSSAAEVGRGTLVLTTNPAGAAVVVDGTHRGSSPLRLDLEPGPHDVKLVTERVVRTVPVTIDAGAEVSQFVDLSETAPEVGRLQVRTEPPGAVVTVDGHTFGRSPITVEGLTPGAHALVLEHGATTVRQTVAIEAGATASVVVPLSTAAPAADQMQPGWIAVNAPIELEVYDGDRRLGASQGGRIPVSAGRRQIQLVNDALGYRATRTVDVPPGRGAVVNVDVPRGSVSINALPWADVWVDGRPLGETPIAAATLPIGVHEVVFRHPELGERRATITVTQTSPVRLSVDLRTN